MFLLVHASAHDKLHAYRNCQYVSFLRAHKFATVFDHCLNEFQTSLSRHHKQGTEMPYGCVLTNVVLQEKHRI